MIRLMLISIDVTGMIAIGWIINVHKRAIVDQFERATRSILNNLDFSNDLFYLFKDFLVLSLVRPVFFSFVLMH